MMRMYISYEPSSDESGHPIRFFRASDARLRGALEWTRTTTPLGTGPQPAAYTIPPRGQIITDYANYITPNYGYLSTVYRPFCR
jgi:hypothetical protein